MRGIKTRCGCGLWLVWVYFLTMWVSVGESVSSGGEPVDFNVEVRPILSVHCFPCHGPDEGSRKARLRLDLREESVRERDGFWAIKPGDASASEVIYRVTTGEAGEVMPPPEAGGPLAEGEVEVLRRWIEEGANYAEHWAWKRPERPVVPLVAGGGENPIDHFVQERWLREGLAGSREADRYSLIRRLSLDITGLPPTPDEVRAFVGDEAEGAYLRLVDRLLASSAYGERWAAVWLDLARYADSAGYGSDPLRPNLWPWRDWVIGALNRNLPYDRFTIEQLAGDLLPNAEVEQQIATAFHRNTMTNTEGGTDDEEYRVAAVKDRASTTAQVWMGLTLGCAQCHTHKYDPISHREYYEFYAFFDQTEDHDQPDERPTLALPTAAEEEKMKALRDRLAELEAEQATDTVELEQEVAEWERRQELGIDWRELEVVEVRSLHGAASERHADGWWEVSGGGGRDVKVIKATLGDTHVTALRLEIDRGERDSSEVAPALLTEVQAALRLPGAEAPLASTIRIELPGPRRVLALAEVEVWHGVTNLALRGKARQSSTDGEAGAERAVDGCRDGDSASGSCARTGAEDDPWWEVELGGEMPIEALTVWNRTDPGLGTQLTGFRVLVLDSGRRTVWEKTVGTAPSPVVDLRLPVEEVVEFAHASGSGADPSYPVEALIDGELKVGNGWGLGGAGAGHAFLELSTNRVVRPGSMLVLTLTQELETGQSLGRLRLASTAHPLPVRELPEEVVKLLAIPREERTEADRRRVTAYAREFAASVRSRRVEMAQVRGELESIRPVALPVMRELEADGRRTTRVLSKGNFLDPAEEVTPGVPGAFHEWREERLDRLGLAGWLTRRENPLTARVMVNRLWARLFGVGLVETEEDFGTQGALPSHRELLDWLAVEFMDCGWDMKAMVRLMVTSATYRQSSVMTPDLLERDPRNRWLARASRVRLEAEMIRDQALALSGLLSRKVGGPSVFPPQPEGLWRAAFNGERTYPTSVGEDRYRRALYVFLRRTVPYPSLATFDAPSREACTFRRLPTNTPLQAFVTLNDPVYVECAQALGRRMIRDGGSEDSSRLRFGLELCLGRPATEEQLRILADHLEAELAHYRARPEEAVRWAVDPLGPMEEGMDVVEAAAWTSVASVLLNLDAVLTRG